MVQTHQTNEALQWIYAIGLPLITIIVGLVIYIYHRQVGVLLEKYTEMKQELIKREEEIKVLNKKIIENCTSMARVEGRITTQVVICNERHREH